MRCSVCSKDVELLPDGRLRSHLGDAGAVCPGGSPVDPRRQRRPTVERDEDWLSPGQVAELMGVTPKTVSRWADSGRLTTARTMGGHRRFPREEVDDLLREATEAGPS